MPFASCRVAWLRWRLLTRKCEQATLPSQKHFVCEYVHHTGNTVLTSSFTVSTETTQRAVVRRQGSRPLGLWFAVHMHAVDTAAWRSATTVHLCSEYTCAESVRAHSTARWCRGCVSHHTYCFINSTQWSLTSYRVQRKKRYRNDRANSRENKAVGRKCDFIKSEKAR